MSARRRGPAGGAPRDFAPVCPLCAVRWCGELSGSHLRGCSLGNDGWASIAADSPACAGYLLATIGPKGAAGVAS